MRLARRLESFSTAVAHTNSKNGRAIYCAIGTLCLLLIGVLFGIRLRHLLGRNIRNLTPIRALTLALYTTALLLIYIELILSTNSLIASNPAACLAGTILDIGFFFAFKLLLHLFLLERVRLTRAATHQNRLRDWTWTIPMAVLGSGFAALGVAGFRFLYHGYDGDTCSLGFPDAVAVSLLTFDIAISISLTGLFVWLLRAPFRLQAQPPPARLRNDPQNASFSSANLKRLCIRIRGLDTNSSDNDSDLNASGPAFTTPRNSFSNPSMNLLIKKTLIGALLVYAPFVTNLAFLVTFRGMEKDWICFVACTVDTTWCVCVTHWLTGNPEEREGYVPPR